MIDPRSDGAMVVTRDQAHYHGLSVTRRLLLFIHLFLVTPSLFALPFSFVENRGQWNETARYMLDRGAMRVWFAEQEVVYDLRGEGNSGHLLRMQFNGALVPELCGDHTLPGEWNYLRGGAGRRSAAGFAELRYDEIYPGIGARYYDQNGSLKYDLLLSPGADPSRIRFNYRGATSVSVQDGELVIATSVGELRERIPYCYQDINGERKTVEARFVVDSRGVGFQLGEYDPSHSLVIDPALLFSSYLGGGGGDAGQGITLDTVGNIYVAGKTRSEDFPTTEGAYRRTISTFNGTSDIFVVKLDPTGTLLLYATYIGGTGEDEPVAIRVMPNGTTVIAGTTFSADFPRASAPGVFSSYKGRGDGFLLGLNRTGNAIRFFTFLGGGDSDRVTSLAIGNFENPYVAGWTRSGDFPSKPGSIPSVRNRDDAFVARFSALADTLIFSVLLADAQDERATGVAVEPGGAAWVTGWTESASFPTTSNLFGSAPTGGREGFAARVRFNGSVLEYSTLIGGSGNDEPAAIVLDTAGAFYSVYITGKTLSPDYPIWPVGKSYPQGSWFVTTFRGSATMPVAPIYSRYVGVNDNGGGRTIQVDRTGEVYLCGTTNSPLFPTTPDAVTGSARGGFDLAFVRLSSDGETIRHASVLGGSGADTVWHQSYLTRFGDLFVTGGTDSRNLPLGRGAYDSTLNVNGSGASGDAFIMRFNFAQVPSIFSRVRRVLDSLRCDTLRLDTFHIYNTGQRDLLVGRSYFALGNSPYRIDSPSTFPRTVRPGDSLRYIVRFVTTNAGTFRDTLVVESNDSLPGRQPLRIAFQTVRAVPILSATLLPPTLRTLLPCNPLFDGIITIGNIGQGIVTLTGLRFAGTDSTFQLLNPPRDSFRLQEGGRLALGVRFRAPGQGSYRDTLLVSFAECTAPLAIPIDGMADTAAVAIVEDELRIPAVPWCVDSLDTLVTVVNRGTVPVSISGGIAGTGFRLLDTLPITLPPGGSDTLRIRFTPVSSGLSTASLDLTGSPCNLSLSLRLQGAKLPRNILATSAPMIDFGTLPGCSSGDPVADSVLRIFNTGLTPLLILSPSISLPFSFRNPPPFPDTLAAGEFLSLPIRFSPRGDGSDSGVVEVRYSASGCLDTLRVTLRGSRERLDVVVSPDTIDLPLLVQCQISADTVVTITNRSSLPLTIVSDSLAGDARSLRGLPFSIAPGGSDTVTIRFSPSQAGNASGSVTFFTDPCREGRTVELRGRKEGIVLGFDSSRLDFPRLLGCQIPLSSDAVATLSNNGSDSVATVTSIRVVGSTSFHPDSSVIGEEIPAGSKLGIPISYAPATVGSDSGLLEVVFAPCNDTVRLELHGRVEEARLVVEGGAFGDLAVGGRLTRSIILRNPTSSRLQVDSLSNILAPFKLLGSQPPLPAQLAPGDSILLDIEFAPEIASDYLLTSRVNVSSPCSFAGTVPLSGRGMEGESDSLFFCLNGLYSGPVGDTLEIAVQLSSPAVHLPSTQDLIYWIRYDRDRLQYVGAGGEGSFDADDSPGSSGHLRLVQHGVDDVRPIQISLRFRLLAGRRNPATVALDSIVIGQGEPVGLVCGDSATILITDRCILTGLSFGRYRNMLEDATPNPAGSDVEITYQQLEDAHALLRLFDVNGREVLRPLDAQMPGGRYAVQFSIDGLPAGIYFYNIAAGTYSESKKLIIVE